VTAGIIEPAAAGSDPAAGIDPAAGMDAAACMDGGAGMDGAAGIDPPVGIGPAAGAGSPGSAAGRAEGEIGADVTPNEARAGGPLVSAYPTGIPAPVLP
jgi:hypothetical protein